MYIKHPFWFTWLLIIAAFWTFDAVYNGCNADKVTVIELAVFGALSQIEKED